MIRILLLIFAENRLDTDEATVGIMAIDILEGKGLPFFFYGTVYNGGGAIEAYIGALFFKLFGPSELLLKLSILIFWVAAAVLFADLCRRTLSAQGAFYAILFFCISTPFFLEWSLKARGGYAETVLFSVLLLWIADPPDYLMKKRDLQSVAFGIVCGIGIYASEMLLAMVVCAGFLLLVRLAKGGRSNAAIKIIVGSIIGLLPLIIYNVTHDFENFKVSLLYNLIMQERESIHVSIKNMLLTPLFILGKPWILLLICFSVASIRLLHLRSSWKLGHIVLIHSCLYLIAYWLSGDRYLAIPPTRTLYALYPGLAILFSYAVDIPRDRVTVKRALATGAVFIWISMVSYSMIEWASSGRPREEGSWRGSWSLIDGEGLYDRLSELNVEEVYTNPWIRTTFLFVARRIHYLNPDANVPDAYFRIPEEPGRAGRRAALVFLSEGGLIQNVENMLINRNIPYQRSEFKNLTIISGLDSSLIHLGSGFPRAFGREDWKPMPANPDGFN